MKRCSRALLLALSLCLILMTAALADAEDFVFALNTSGDGYVVTGYTGSETSVTVPDWYNGDRQRRVPGADRHQVGFHPQHHRPHWFGCLQKLFQPEQADVLHRRL